MKHLHLLLLILLPIVTEAQYVLQPSDITVDPSGYITACNKSFSGSETSIIIPETINGITIVGIQNKGCYNGVFYRKGLTSVQFPNTIKHIGDNAFNSNALTGEISFNNCSELTYIGTQAFWSNNISSIRLDSCTNLVSIGIYAFLYNPNLTGNLNLSNCSKLEAIGTKAFQHCSLTGVSISSSKIKSINESVFADNNLQTVNLSNCTELTYIKASAFEQNQIAILNLTNCPKLEYFGNNCFNKNQLASVDYNNIKSIGKNAFSNNKITNVDLSNCSAITSIEESAFENNLINSINLPNTITSFKPNCFNNNKLTNVDLSTLVNLTLIANSAFSNNNISSVNLNNCTSLISIGASAFKANQISILSLTNCPNITSLGSYCFSENNITAIDFTLLPNLNNIGEQVFSFNKLGGNVSLFTCLELSYIGKETFANNNDITNITLPNNTQWMSSSSQIYGIGGSTTDYYSTYYTCHTLVDDDVVVENGIITACSYDFQKPAIIIPEQLDQQTITGIANSEDTTIFKQKNISYLKLPSTILEIGHSAFASCVIEVVDFSECTDLSIIGKLAFFNNRIKTTIDLQNCLKLKQVDYRAFFNNPDLSSVKLPNPNYGNEQSFLWEDLKAIDNKYEITDFYRMYNSAHTVIFTAQDGTVLGKDTVTYNQTAITPSAPQINEHTFIGWSPGISNVCDTLTTTAQYIRNDADKFIFKLGTNSGKAISLAKITLDNNYAYTYTSGIASMSLIPEGGNYTITNKYLYADIAGTIAPSLTGTTISIDTLNTVSFFNPESDFSFTSGTIELNGKTFDIKNNEELEIFIADGTYNYTFNHNNNLAPSVTGTFIINGSDIHENLDLYASKFIVKTDKDTLVNDATVSINSLGISTQTNQLGEAIFYLPQGTYNYSVTHNLLADTINSSFTIANENHVENISFYSADFLVKANHQIPFNNAKISIGTRSTYTNEFGEASLYTSNGNFNYKISHSLFGVDSIYNSFTINNAGVFNNIDLFRVDYNIIANNNGIENCIVNIGNKALSTNVNGSTSTYLPNGVYTSTISHSGFLRDSLVSTSVHNGNVSTNIELHQANFLVNNSNYSAYNGATVSICDTNRTIPATGLSLYLPLGSYSFEISDSSNLAGNAIGIVSNEATATNHIFSVYEANFNLKTEQGSFVDYMDVAIDNVTASTNYNTGMATIKLFNGTYTYRIANNTLTGNLTIANRDTSININSFHDAFFYVSIPNGSTWFNSTIQINNKELEANYRDSIPKISLPSGTFSFNIHSEFLTIGSSTNTLQIPENSNDTITTMINPFDFIVTNPQGDILTESEINIENETYTGADPATKWAFKGSYSYMVSHPAMIDTAYGSVNIVDNSWGSNYLNHVQSDTVKLAQLTILADNLPMVGANFYKDMNPTTEAVKTSNSGCLYFANSKTYNYEIYTPSLGAITGTINIEQAKADTINLFTLTFNSNNDNCYLAINGDTLSNSLRRTKKLLVPNEYSYKTFYNNGYVLMPLDSGIVSPTNKVITQNVYTPLFLVHSKADNSRIFNVNYSTNQYDSAYNTGAVNNMFELYLKENETVICSIFCNGYKDTSFVAPYNNTFNTIKLTPAPNTVYYTATFKDWDKTTLSRQIVKEDSAAIAPDNPVRESYTFTGWDVAFTNVTSNLTVTAQYRINSYTVTFLDWNNTELKTESVEHGSDATAPVTPTRTGYTFTSWDINFTNVTSELTVIAQYSLSTSINGNTESKLTIYPNPVKKGWLNIKSDKTISEIRLYNHTGNEVFKTKENTKYIDVRNLPKGVYLIKVDDITRRIVIM